MRCTVGNANLGVWCRSIHTLTQVGDEDVYFDCSDTILTVSTVNSSLSCYSTFLFFKPFFTSYQMTNEEPEKIVVPAKIILKPYRTLRVVKNYLSSEIKYNPNEDYLMITSEGKSHVSSTYKLGASSNSNELEVDCDPYALQSFIKADAKVLSSCLSNFTHVKGLAELTLKIQGHKVVLKNSVTDVARKDGSVVTEYNLTSQDFVEYEVQNNSVELIFGFREFKIFTTFAEQLKLPLTIHFQSESDPVIITVKTDTFEARLAMAQKMKDPFADVMPAETGTPLSCSSNGRISSVTTQSQTSSRNVTVEVNRRRPNGTVSIPDISDTTDRTTPAPPAAKKPRRTEAPLVEPPVVDQPGDSVADIPMDDAEPVEDLYMINPDPVPISIGPIIERMENRMRSKAYRTLHLVATRPSITEAEYLRSIPGHDIVICPDSDEES